MIQKECDSWQQSSERQLQLKLDIGQSALHSPIRVHAAGTQPLHKNGVVKKLLYSSVIAGKQRNVPAKKYSWPFLRERGVLLSQLDVTMTGPSNSNLLWWLSMHQRVSLTEKRWALIANFLIRSRYFFLSLSINFWQGCLAEQSPFQLCARQSRLGAELAGNGRGGGTSGLWVNLATQPVGSLGPARGQGVPLNESGKGKKGWRGASGSFSLTRAVVGGNNQVFATSFFYPSIAGCNC